MKFDSAVLQPVEHRQLVKTMLSFNGEQCSPYHSRIFTVNIIQLWQGSKWSRVIEMD